MAKYIPLAGKCLLLLFVTLGSCTKRFSEVSIYSNLQEGDSISVALHSIVEDRYYTVNSATVTAADAARHRIDLSLPDSLVKSAAAMSFTVHRCSAGILTVSAIRLNGYATIGPQDMMGTLWWQNGLAFAFDPESDAIKSPVAGGASVSFPVGIDAFHFPSRPLGFQLFLRISLIVAFVILIFIFTTQAPDRRILFFAVALFLASFPLKIDYANCTMILMLLIAVITFVRSKSRHFSRHPIFYLLCAIYLLNIIGLLYTGNFRLGFRHLDSNIPLVLFPVVFGMMQLSGKNTVLLLRFFVWTVIVFCTFGLLSYAMIVPEFTWDTAFSNSKPYAKLLLMWPAYWHPSYTAAILLFAVPVALYLRFQAEKRITVAEMIPGVLLPIVFSVPAGARIGMVISPLLLGLGYVFYCRFKPVFKWGLVVAGVAAVCVLLFLFPQVGMRFNDPIRKDLREIAVNAVREKPVFGWGTGYAAPLIQSEETARRLGIGVPYDLNQFHNQYLEDAVQFGIPGILVLTILLGGMLWSGIRKKDYLLLSLLAIYMPFMFTESVLASSKGVVPFTFWLCFLMIMQKERLGKMV